ncbi:unnamed protein product [Trifolium pratense]|uniref:Uncharacterized protein n=1 Tax=Trifolium pratense TaxID=57577 RepID=A0ACB0KE13_TRIPR|nr:unnamed protein product [Trifolium pratense]
MQNKKNMAKIDMFIYALIIIFITFFVESFADKKYLKTNIPCRYNKDCPPLLKNSDYVWLCKEKFCVKIAGGLLYPDAQG